MQGENRPGRAAGPGRRQILAEVQSLAEPLARSMGLDLVDLEYVKENGRRFLRVFLDRQGGITLDECQAFSQALSGELDARDPIPESYYLEVASPGLDRPLKKDRDFETFRGRRVRVNTYGPLDGQKVFTGVLEGLEDGAVVLREEGSRSVRRIPRDQVARARLAEEPWQEGDRG